MTVTPPAFAPVPDELRTRLLSVAVPTLSAILYGKGFHTRFLHGLTPLSTSAAKLCGPAHTVRAIPVREDLREAMAKGRMRVPHRVAFDAAPAGSVLVCGTGGAARVSVLGDIIATALMRRGVAGVVVDTGVSDIAAVSGMALPVFAAGSAPVPAPAIAMVIDHGLPIGIAGVAVFPNDLLVGDANGVICIPREIADEVADYALEKERHEEFILQEIEAGAPLDGTYPPNAAAIERYNAWKAGRVQKN